MKLQNTLAHTHLECMNICAWKSLESFGIQGEISYNYTKYVQIMNPMTKL